MYVAARAAEDAMQSRSTALCGWGIRGQECFRRYTGSYIQRALEDQCTNLEMVAPRSIPQNSRQLDVRRCYDGKDGES